MLEVKDLAIKLFGKRIPLLANEEASPWSVFTATHVASADDDDHEQQQHCSYHNLVSSTTPPRDKFCNGVGDGQEDNKKPSQSELTECRQEEGASHPTAEEIKDPATPCEISPKVSKNNEQCETSISQEKTLKKPDKILPCPRCNSMDTKFCYYNNYNVNQPRHFCRNCKRYWTAGGTMRNVPVGSGRRKNKSSSASHYHQLMVSEVPQAPSADAANGLHHPNFRTNGTVLTFGSDAPLCESMATTLNLAEKSHNCGWNGFHRPEQKISVSFGARENRDDHSSWTSTTASDSEDKGGNSGLQESVMKNFQTLPHQVPYFPGPAWPYPWNSPQWKSAMPPPAFGPFGLPITFYPTPAYWDFTLPGAWNVPWLSPPSASPKPAMCSSPKPSILGKHSRDGDMLKQSNSEEEEPFQENNLGRCVWIPKTLRIDDPSEAAKSSIWSTFGIHNEKNDSVKGGGLFKAFQKEGDENNHKAETSLVLQANPSALNRSLNFHECV